MTELAAAGQAASTWRDYLELCKPRVVLLMLVCTAAGMLLATEHFAAFDLLLATLLGVGLVASSAAVVNHVADQHVDARMARTRNRPVATGRVSNARALVFSAVMGIAGLGVLAVFVNPLTAWLNLASWVGYGLVYTLYLKRATPQNIVIGGLFGAAPPLFGWTAVTGSIDPGALLLVMIIFAWTPPHFWALALDRRDEYARVEVPMLPITHGVRYTQWQILFYTLLLFASSLLPFAIGMSGLLYLAAAVALGAGFIYWAIALLCGLHPRAAIETFRYSIVYLLALFVALLVDHYVDPTPAVSVLSANPALPAASPAVLSMASPAVLTGVR
jgi:protoheme IX farnesyltransferase